MQSLSWIIHKDFTGESSDIFPLTLDIAHFSKYMFYCFQAFLEMADETSAVAMVTYFSGCMAQLRGRAVYVQFSNHKELKTDQTHSNAVSYQYHIFEVYIC